MPNDFLSSLSARILHSVDPVTDGLKPRLVARFESPIAPTMDKTPEGGDEVETETAQHAEPSMTFARALEQEPSEERKMRSPQNDRTQAKISLRFDINRDETAEFADQDQSTPQPTQSIRAERHSEGFPMSFPPKFVEPVEMTDLYDARHTTMPPLSRPAMALPEPDRGIEADKNPDRKDALQASIPSMEQPGEARTNATLVPPPENQAIARIAPERIIVTRAEQPAPMSGIQPRIVPAAAVPERKPQTAQPETESQPPTIHVTIGRIEVKAAVPVTLPKRSAPASSTMSLEEYLRRRQGGSR